MTLTLEALQQRITRLEDIAAIQQIVARYGPMADCGDGEGVAQLWAEDGDYVVGDMARFAGHDGLKAMIAADTHQGLIAAGCAHFQASPAIELTGDSAVATAHSVLLLQRDGGFEVLRVSANRWELARGEAGWKVTHRTNRLLNGDSAATAVLNMRGIARAR